jgi:hypothetical protein
MKSIFTKITLVLLAGTTLFSCSVEKRYHSGGWNIGLRKEANTLAVIPVKKQKAGKLEQLPKQEGNSIVAKLGDLPKADCEELVVTETERELTEGVALAKKKKEISLGAMTPHAGSRGLSYEEKPHSAILKQAKLTPPDQKEGQQKGSGWGIASFVCGLLGLFFLPILFGPLAIIFGFLGINKPLKGLAISGLAMGFISVIIMFLLIGILLAV